MEHGGVVVLFALLTALMTWPMVAHFGEAVLGPPGDNLEYVWKMWWFKQALLERRASPFFVPEVFYPFGYPLALSETTLAHTIAGLPFTALWGEVVAYNVVVYLSFVWSGYAAYLLARTLGCGPVGALIAGLVFAFCPYRLAHLGAGHLPMMGTGWIALAFLALERLIRRPSWRGSVLLGCAFGLTALSSWYYALIVGPFLVLYLLLRARPAREALWRRELWLWLGVGGLVSALLIAPVALPLVRLYLAGEMGEGYSLGYVDRWSASPLDFIYPNAMHPLWGAWLTERYDAQNVNENMLYLGLVALALAGVGLKAASAMGSPRRHQDAKAHSDFTDSSLESWCLLGKGVPNGRPLRVFAIVGLVGFVLALGTTLHWGEEALRLRVPAVWEHQFSRAMYVLTGRLAFHKVDYSPLRAEGTIPLPLPGLLLYLFVPGMKAMRVWGRFGVLTILAVAVLAGWGADWLWERLGGLRPGARWAVTVGLSLLVLMDFAAFPYAYGYTEVRPQAVDLWLAEQPKGSPIIHYPLEKTWYGWMLYPMRVHGQPIAYGYGTFVPQAYRQGVRAVQDWPSVRALKTLRSWGVRYVLMGARSYGPAWPAVRETLEALPGVREVAVFEDQPIYRGDRLFGLLRPRAEVPATELINGDRQSYLRDEVHVYAIQ